LSNEQYPFPLVGVIPDSIQWWTVYSIKAFLLFIGFSFPSNIVLLLFLIKTSKSCISFNSFEDRKSCIMKYCFTLINLGLAVNWRHSLKLYNLCCQLVHKRATFGVSLQHTCFSTSRWTICMATMHILNSLSCKYLWLIILNYLLQYLK